MNKIMTAETAGWAAVPAAIPRIGRQPQIGIIIPVYGHPVLLAEAVESALAQICVPSLGIVIVSDGCPHPETDRVAAAYATAHPHVVYLRKRNGGPSSARNYGIDFALRAWPEMEAVFFLDADNRLTPTALDDAWTAMQATPGIGWIYSHITSFGIAWSANYGAPYSPLLHLVYDNICDTGSLVARAVLESGVRFDEDARSGYEDWDFWLQCLERGFLGKHAPFGFAYRQRPESRFREMNRSRGAMIEHLRRRHPSIAAPANLLRWEHESNPRYLHRAAGLGWSCGFTDPARRDTRVMDEELSQAFFAALQQPDEVLVPPFFVWGSATALTELERLRLIHSAFALLEREAQRTNFAALTLEATADEVGVRIGPPDEVAAEAGGSATLHARAVLWMCEARLVREIVADAGDGWFRSLGTATPGPNVTEIRVRAPFGPALGRPDAPQEPAVAALLETMELLRASPFRENRPERWNWRPLHFPPREEYYRHACRYLGVTALLPRVPDRRPQVALLLPIASYGGAEKVAYAMARFLRDNGASVNLLIVGAPKMKVIPEYEGVFDTIGFLADPEFPIWGGPITVFGQECFLPDAPEVKGPDVVGLLCGFDLVVNCHSAPINSVMGMLRALKIRTATYLHVFDTTKLRRTVGHPYLTIGFEHAYDLVLTCSRQLAEDLHALGIPSDKIMPIRNAASFSVPLSLRDGQRVWRAQPRGDRKLRALYIGRLDRQKGVERLLGAIEQLLARGQPVEFRLIGSGLLEADGTDWAAALARLGIALQPPVYGSEALAEAYAWADVLLLPSLWEGAPLVIPECHQLGCIPVATDVGAVGELTTNGVDGLLVESGEERQTATAMADAVESLIRDDSRRQAMAENALCRSELNQWDTNFAPIRRWLNERVRGFTG